MQDNSTVERTTNSDRYSERSQQQIARQPSYGGGRGAAINENRSAAGTSETRHSTQGSVNEAYPMNEVPKLQNIVSTAFLGQRIVLRTVAQRVGNAEYNPRRFAAAIIRIRNPKSTALVFESGKMVITGARSEEESEQAAK